MSGSACSTASSLVSSNTPRELCIDLIAGNRNFITDISLFRRRPSALSKKPAALDSSGDCVHALKL